VRWLDIALKQGGTTPNAPAKQPSKSSVEPELSKAPTAQSNSGVELLRKPSAHRTPAPAAQFKTAIAGHIDLLQWKFDTLYILYFKPNARKEQKRKVATQLSLYAMALPCRAKVPMEQMRCAWLDGEDFFSFKPTAII